MHELSLAGAVIDTAERHAGGRRVLAVRLRLGELRQVVPDSLAFYFGHVARGTLCEGAVLEHEVVRAELTCAGCDARFGLDGALFRCPAAARPMSQSSRGTNSRSNRSRLRSQHAPGEGSRRRGCARRQQHHCAGQPRGLRPSRGGRRQPHERARRGQDGLLERALERPLGDGIRVGVLEGDVQGRYDADAHRLPARPCDADQHGLRASAASATSTPTWCEGAAVLPLAEIDLLVIENVGNLVCPAEFRVGEDVRVMVAAITEGEDKPLKYPLMFRTCELVLINKIDLLPHLEFDLEELLANIDAVHPDVETMVVSARTGEGVEAWRGGSPSACAARRRVRSHEPRPSPSPRRSRSTRGLAVRREAGGQLFAREAARIARLCHAVAERFARGGRLLACGCSPAGASDARHVAVEFVHPVIVGKRALPALALLGEGARLADEVGLKAREQRCRARIRRAGRLARARGRTPACASGGA